MHCHFWQMCLSPGHPKKPDFAVPQTVVIFGFPYTPVLVHKIPVATVIFTLCPWSLLVKGLSDLGNAASGGIAGITWAGRDRYGCMPAFCTACRAHC